MTTIRIKTLAMTTMTVGALLLSGCSFFERGDKYGAGDYVDDATITSKIKADYVGSDRVSAPAVSVETMNGTVLLSGFVKTAAEKARAEEIARTVKGVKSVKNAIVVRN